VLYADYAEIAQTYVKPLTNQALITYIRANTSARDYVLMWGAGSSYNFITRRASPSRFVYQTPLYNIRDQDNVMEFLNDVLANRPRLIIMPVGDRLSDFRFAYRDNQVGALMDRIKSLYSPAVEMDKWVIYAFSGQ
jgi:hypothetical protein